MYYWFSAYSGYDWTPQRGGYNETFRQMIVLLRDWFGLRKDRSGREVGTGKWVDYNLQREDVRIVVDSLRWDDYRECRDSGLGYVTPVLHFEVRIARWAGRRQGGFLGMGGTVTGDWEVFFDNTIIVEFPERYPSEPPRFRIDDRRYDVAMASHSHHMFTGGWFCILADPHDWNASRDTIVSGLNAAFDWVVWHNQRHGY